MKSEIKVHNVQFFKYSIKVAAARDDEDCIIASRNETEGKIFIDSANVVFAEEINRIILKGVL